VRVADTFIGGLGVYLAPRVSVEWAVQQGLISPEDAGRSGLVSAAVAGQTPAAVMALQAAQESLKHSGLAPEELDLLLYASTWHQGPEGWLPHSYLQRHLVGGRALSSGVSQGCNGMFSALELAACYLRADPGRRAALLVAADNFGTPLINRWRMGPSPGFFLGDASSAIVLTKEPGIARLLAVGSGTVPEAEELHRGTEPLFPPGITLGCGVDFEARSREYQQAEAARGTGAVQMIRVQQELIRVARRTLAEADTEIGDIARVAFMNYSREAVEQRCMASLMLPYSLSTWDFGRTIGHCGASDQVISLHHLVTTGQLHAGDRMLLIGTGPGVVTSCAVVEILGQSR
jgi:3-oxoacyl-[acyl-carrier-protein] synthase-3/clorobiocin biosynthesis protein CloN2